MEQVVWYRIMSDFEHKEIVSRGIQILNIRTNQIGKGIRIELSNEYGQEDLLIKGLQININNNYFKFLFNGLSQIVIPRGKTVISDSLRLNIDSNELLIKIETELGKKISTLGSSKSRYLVDDFSDTEPFYYYGIKKVYLDTEREIKHLAFFGDSLINQSYFSDQVAKRIKNNYPDWISYNCGISGNRLLKNANSLSLWASSFNQAGVIRFENDVFDHQRPKILIFMQGINDLYQPGNESPIAELVTMLELKQGLMQINVICNKYHCRFIPCTITPFKGIIKEGKNWDLVREKVRKEINEYIRSLPNCLDLARYVEDIDDSSLLADFYDSGDGLHFNQLGGQKIGDFIFEQIKELLEEDE